MRIEIILSIFLTIRVWNSIIQYQLQDGKREKHRQETKWHATEKPRGHPRNQKKNQEITWDKWKLKNTTFQRLWEAAQAVPKREVYINTALPQETREIDNQTYHVKELEI